LGGVGRGNWYRFDKKTTTDECHSVDVRYLHREGLLKPGRWFSLRWSRAGRESDSIRGAVEESDKPKRVLLLYRHQSGPGNEWEDVYEPVSLDWTICNFGGGRPWFICPGVGCGSRVRPEGGGPLRAGEVFPVPSLLRSSLREPAGERDAPCPSPGAGGPGEAWRERELDEAFSRRSQRGCTGRPTSGSGGSTTRRRLSS
jgi:hypothetical protein